MTRKVTVGGRNRHSLCAHLVETKDALGLAGSITGDVEKDVVLQSGDKHRCRPEVRPDAPETAALKDTNLPHGAPVYLVTAR